jgi:DNA-binding transcriptional MerR regulator
VDGYSISQTAERTGFAPSALRFYEHEGLVRPGRTPAGYRSYTETDVETLRFVARAKSFGLTLEEITDLVSLLDGERCAPVQGRLRDLVEARITEAQSRVVELIGFASDLQRVAAGLRAHTPDGPCDDACGCTADARTAAARPAGVDVARTGGAPAPGDPPILCTLTPDAVGDRVADWRAMLGGALGREETAGGVRVRFDRATDVARLAALVAAETECCGWATFAITIGPDEVVLEVSGPAGGRDAIVATLGAG